MAAGWCDDLSFDAGWRGYIDRCDLQRRRSLPFEANEKLNWNLVKLGCSWRYDLTVNSIH